MAFQIASLGGVYSAVSSGQLHRNIKGPRYWPFVWEPKRWSFGFLGKGPVTRKASHYDDVTEPIRKILNNVLLVLLYLQSTYAEEQNSPVCACRKSWRRAPPPGASWWDDHRINFEWSSIWSHSNTGLSSTHYEQIPTAFGVWHLDWLLFFVNSILEGLWSNYMSCHLLKLLYFFWLIYHCSMGLWFGDMVS